MKLDKTFDVLNKNDSSCLEKVSFLSDEQLQDCVANSVEAFGKLQKMSNEKRSELLSLCAKKLSERESLFSEIISLEAGKPITYAKVEVQRAVRTLELAAKECLTHKIKEHHIIEGKKTYFRRFILGPVLGITPFNFPLNLMMHKIAPALAVGASIVIKPSLFTPLTSLAFANLIDEVGFPKGSVLIAICDDTQAETLVKNKAFSMLSFTGSAKIGWMLKEICGKKKIALELGGNAPVIIEEVDDMDDVVKTVAIGCFLYAGQICISTQRILINEKLYLQFKEKFLKEVEQIKSGLSTDEKTINGPLISSDSLKRIEKAVMNSEGKCLIGGKIYNQTANIYAPTVLEDVPRKNPILAEEIFGPVCILESYKDFSGAIELANDSQYGLQIGVYASSQALIDEAFNRLEYAGIIINNVPGYRDDGMPYGGVKNSGFGREGVSFTMKEMTELKLMVI